METQNKLIDQFHKNSVELVEIHLTKWKGKDYADLRIFYLPNPAEEGSEVATKKGICLDAELLPKLIRGLQKAQRVIEKEVEIYTNPIGESK